MADESVSERVLRVFKDFRQAEPGEITLNTTFEELGFDSLDGLNLVFELEEEFDIAIPDDKAQAMGSVSEVIAAIEDMLEAKEE